MTGTADTRNTEQDEITSQTRCLRCGRHLSAASVKDNYGAGCRARIHHAATVAALVGFSPKRLRRAAELIADGAIVPIKRLGVWRTVGRNGAAVYLTAPTGCNCLGGLNGRQCYHVASARVLTATRKAA